MELISQRALRVARLIWRPGHGGFAFTVVCKATFELRPGVSPLAAAQEPVTEADVYFGEGAGLMLASDLVPFKKRPEVLIAGHAYAPEGSPAMPFVARLVVGEINKAVHVDGHRAPSGAGRHVRPAGLGPLAPLSPSRAGCLHGHLASWDPDRWNERPLPADIDLAYFNAAPPDQQRTLPFGQEQIYLENLHPRFAQLSTRLAPVTPTATVEQGSGWQSLQLRCDTLTLDTDRGLAMLVWRAHVLLDHPASPGRLIVAGSPVLPHLHHTQADESSTVDFSQLASFSAQAASPLPFVSGTARSPSPAHAPAPSFAAPAPAVSLASAEARMPNGAPGASNVTAEPILGETTMPVDLLIGATLDFGAPSPSDVLPFVAVSAVTRPGHQDVTAPPSPPVGVLVSGSPWGAQPCAETTSNLPPTASPEAASPCPPSAVPSIAFNVSPDPSQPVATLAPPTLLGALALASAEDDDARATRRPPPPEDTAQGDPASPEADPRVDFDAYPPERCGTIAARIACDERCAADILRDAGLDAARWKRVREYWLGRIFDEAARSRRKPLSDYDAAYVRALEAMHRPITVDEYARLAEAAERNAIAEALAAHGLPESTWPHIQRVWIGRIAMDIRVGKQVRTTIDALRAAG